MSDTEDVDLEALRQAALSSLIKKKNAESTHQTNALFYRPTANSNLISIQPVQSDYERDEENDDASSSSGSEYAVIEEGLSVSSADVDEVIEEVIVSEEEDSSDEEEGGEDAISIASHDSFDAILNSVEEELKGGKKRTASTSHAPDGLIKAKRTRRESDGRSKLSRDSDRERDQRPRNDRNYSPGRQRRRSPPRPNLVPARIRNRSRSIERRRSFDNGRRSPRNNSARRTNTNTRAYSRSPNDYRKPRIKSPPQDSKRIKSTSRSPLPPSKRDRSRSPTENRKPRSRSKSPITTSVTVRKPISPPPSDNRRKPITTGRSYTSQEPNTNKNASQRRLDRPRSDSKSRDDRQINNRRGLNNNKEHKSRSPERRNNRARDTSRKSLSPRAKRLEINFNNRRSRSKSPIRKMLSFGDSHLRGQEKRSDNIRRSVTAMTGGSRRGDSRRSDSPKNGKSNPTRRTPSKSKSPEVKSRVEKPVRKKSRSRTRSPASPRLQNLTEEEREKLEKRRLKFGSSVGKVSGKVVLKNSNSPSNDNNSKSKEDRRRPASEITESSPKKSRIGSRLGKVVRDDEEFPATASNRRANTDEAGSQNKPSRSPLRQRDDPGSKDIDTEDLRTKLQQRRAANVGRIFSVAMRDTLHKDSSPGSGTDRDRDRYGRNNRNNKNSRTSSRK